MKYHVTDRNDEVQGPYSLDEIRNLLASGGIESTALSCEEGSETWLPLVSILPPVPAKDSQPAPVKPPRTSDNPAPKPGVSVVLVICIVIVVALLSVAAYFIGRRL